MTREHWLGLAIAVIAIVATLCLLALLEEDEAEGRMQVDCVDPDTRESIRKLSLEGYDHAFRDHTANLFRLWVQDEQDQPKRARVGTQSGISAYVRARSMALAWNPPPCPTEKQP